MKCMNIKKILLIAAIVVFTSISVVSQKKKSDERSKTNSQKNEITCPANSDNLYQRQMVLEKIAEILSISIPEFAVENRYSFGVRNEKPKGFEIYDLSDALNNTEKENCINFINKHVYHVYPGNYEYSFSHIIFLENGELKVFRSVNCKDRGETIEDAVEYLKMKLPEDDNKSKTLENVKNYRRFGEYTRMCAMSSPGCQLR